MRYSHVEARLEQQIQLNNLIANSYDNLIKVGQENLTTNRIHARLTILKDDWEKFSIIHEAIGIAIKELNPEEKQLIQKHSYFTENWFSTTRELYLENTERINLLFETDLGISQGTSSSRVNTPVQFGQPQYHLARLPRIDLPKFNGTPADWLSFKDLFNSLILVNPTLTSVEKLQYLKVSLIGSASHLLKNTAVTDDNFQGAWETLIAFYENKRLLVNMALHALLNLKRMSKESATEMERLYTSIMQIYRSLQNLGRPVQTWDNFLIFLATQRLDSESIKAWEHQLGSAREPPTWSQFTEFLVTRLRSLQAFEKSRSGQQLFQSQQTTIKSHYQGKSNDNDTIKGYNCSLCSSKHHTSTCSQYNTKSVQQKMALINKHKLCYNCLGNHRVAACRTSKRCIKCGRKHHTSIHPGSFQSSKTKLNDNNVNKSATNSSTEEAKVLHSATTITSSPLRILLATARIKVTSLNGNTTTIRALIDQGSEVSLITERLVQRLKANRSHSSISLTGIRSNASNRTKGVVNLKLSPHFKSEYEFVISAHILINLISPIPSVKIDKSSWSHLDGLQLADLQFTQPGSIDLILGADVYGAIINEGLVKGSLNTPIAQHTAFGWIISGPTKNENFSEKARSYYVSKEEDLYLVLRKFWELEEVPSISNNSLTPEEQECENHFKLTHSRDSHGRYVVKLPFKRSVDNLGNSKRKATHLIHKLNKSFISNPTYAKMYTEFLTEYEALKHMKLVPSSLPEPSLTYYLPHHGVLKEARLTTKLRVVFNGSSKTTSGISLNDLLHVGPKLQTNLFDVLIWFRQFRYVFSSDIEKMYRQIKVHSDDWNYQRILWLNDTNCLLTYQLVTVTYGLVCAPFLALRVMTQLVNDEGDKFPLAVPILNIGRYVDDLFGSADSIEQAQSIVQQVNQLCMAGGLRLHKWSTNQPEVLHYIPEKDRVPLSSLSIEEHQVIHSLGLSWQPTTDNFLFISNSTLTEIITKRIVLSSIAKLFDPLGLLSPIIIVAKILMQEIWTLHVEWDDILPSTITNKWISFVNGLKDLPTLTFPRWLGLKSDQLSEIHGFSDASTQAYAAVVYCRSISSDGVAHTQLICSKAKVAPLKRNTIPRLEPLAGAVLLTKLVTHLLKVLSQNNVPIFLWTDSTITYTWINSHPSRWKDFVHNRVCYIQESLPHAQWGLVSGKENPADLATRGLSPMFQLSENNSWWIGPDWLLKSFHSWPQKPTSIETKETLEERPIKVTTTHVKLMTCWDLLLRYSNLKRLIKITAICQRVVKRLRKIPNSSLHYPITIIELQIAKRFWVKTVQNSDFRQEFKLISTEKSLPSSHPFTRLTPFTDSYGVLRVGGRLRASSLGMEAKHPAILPRDSPFTTLVIADAHLRTLHGGTQITLCTIREEFWIIGGRVPIRSYILKCIQCTRFRRSRAQQLMGQLPKERVTPSRPFMNTGVDYLGPLLIRTWRGRNARTYKAYIALFVCFSTSAIHLELVTDYTAEAFMAAYKRFSGRRGICATLWSDCGTTFKGADAELQRLFSKATAESKLLATLLAKDGTQWRFNPPSTPHFGGKWEAGVKSVKYHLHRVIGETSLTYEEMTTLLTQIEAILNSRPLTPCSDDPDDLNVLIPGHFLIGCAPTYLSHP